MAAHFELAPPPTRRTAIGGYPRVISYDMLGEQLYNCKPVKCGYATCLPHRDGGVPLIVLPKDTTSNLAGFFSTLFLLYAKGQAEKPCIPFFEDFCYDSTQRMNPGYIDCEADALTTARSQQALIS